MRTTRLCQTIQAQTMADLRRGRDLASGVDLVELRLDGVADLDVAGALEGRRLPVIVTCRPVWEGGLFEGSEEERLAILRRALALGAELVDVEWRAAHAELLAATGGRRLVLSTHEFDTWPADLTNLARALLATGAEVVKIAVPARRLSDCVRLLRVADGLDAAGRLVLIGMGECGLATRVCAARFGSAWSYAGSVAGVGQISAQRLLDDYRFRQISGETDIYGVIGRPVAHSVSPAMHNAAFASTGRNAVYLPLPAVDADDAVDFVNGMRMKGASITIPYKVPLAGRMDETDTVAREIGAVNTLRVEGRRWHGTNTDVAGFLQPLEGRRLEWATTRASVLGAGGSARAVVAGLVGLGARVTVHARTREKAAPLATSWPVTVGPWPPEPGSWDLLVNCTPIGMHPGHEASPIPADRLTGRLVYDLVYNPFETRLRREAAAAGCDTIGGLDMLVAQAREQSLWWTGVRPPTDVMHAAATRRLREFMFP